MTRTAIIWRGLRALIDRRRVQFALSIRVTTAALVALALAQFLHLYLPLWAVLTAVIATQMNVGRSLKTTFDYLGGTLGGAIYGGVIGWLIPHPNELGLFLVLAFAVAPLALIARMNPRFSVVPITAIVVLLVPTFTQTTPVGSVFDRVIEVTLGGVAGLVVSFFLLTSNAHPLVVAAAARALNQMARALGQLLTDLTHGLNVDRLHRIQDGFGEALVQMNTVAKVQATASSAAKDLTAVKAKISADLHALKADVGRASISSTSKSPKSARRIWNGRRASQLTMQLPQSSRQSLRCLMRPRPVWPQNKRKQHDATAEAAFDQPR